MATEQVLPPAPETPVKLPPMGRKGDRRNSGTWRAILETVVRTERPGPAIE
jgi:hypothetical protein